MIGVGEGDGDGEGEGEGDAVVCASPDCAAAGSNFKETTSEKSIPTASTNRPALAGPKKMYWLDGLRAVLTKVCQKEVLRLVNRVGPGCYKTLWDV